MKIIEPKKNRVVTYTGNLPETGLKRHRKKCFNLQPTSNKPFTGSRKLKKKEMQNFEPCKRC
jgi:hypothetical protein